MEDREKFLNEGHGNPHLFSLQVARIEYIRLRWQIENAAATHRNAARVAKRSGWKDTAKMLRSQHRDALEQIHELDHQILMKDVEIMEIEET